MNFKAISLAAASAALCLAAVSCDKKNDLGGLSASEKEMKNIVEQYVPGVVYATYGDLAKETGELYDLLAAAAEGGVKTLTQAQLDAICAKFLQARQSWEESEAFLFGAASDFGIDPHIDTWPLDVDGLATELSNAEKVESLRGEDGIAYAAAKLGQELLGFHGIEFVLFRDGKNRTLASLMANESDPAFKSKVTGEEELIYATAVAGDLRDKCFQLEVAWRGESAAKAHQDRVEECEFETQIGSFFYGEHIFKATQAGSIYNSWQEVLVAIFDAGCSNIANEVANTKMGLAYTGEDPNYIESPYSKKSFVDFYDNVMSIKNSLYGGINLSTPAKKSAIDLLKTYNTPLAGSMEAAISGALAALQNCQAGTAFVDDPRAAKVKAAMDAINHLDEQLAAAATWASTIK